MNILKWLWLKIEKPRKIKKPRIEMSGGYLFSGTNKMKIYVDSFLKYEFDEKGKMTTFPDPTEEQKKTVRW